MIGSYSIGTCSGLIVPTGAVSAVLWACRWIDPDLVAEIERLKVAAVVTATITAAVPYDLAAFRAVGFTTPPNTGVAVADLSGNARLTDVGKTKAMEIYTLTTLAAGMTGHVATLDPEPLARVSGASGLAIANQFFGGMVELLSSSIDRDPVSLGKNEGIVIAAPLAGPATGSFRVSIDLDWKERMAA